MGRTCDGGIPPSLLPCRACFARTHQRCRVHVCALLCCKARARPRQAMRRQDTPLGACSRDACEGVRSGGLKCLELSRWSVLLSGASRVLLRCCFYGV
jgi:hypothetical protein